MIWQVVGMIYIASNSNGKDSLWMILELIRRKYPLDVVLFFDGGKEFQAIYDIWERVKKILDNSGIKWDVVRPDYDFDYCFSEKKINTKTAPTPSKFFISFFTDDFLSLVIRQSKNIITEIATHTHIIVRQL